MKFERWTVLDTGGRKWLCECDCGTTRKVDKYNLISGGSKSCGCLSRENIIKRSTKHGLGTKDKRYGVWAEMKQRCTNPNHIKFKSYGDRGIKVCDDWFAYENFYKWSEVSGYSEGLSLDRIDNNKGYSPDNCRWTDAKTQANNTRRNVVMTINGITRTLAEHARFYNMDAETLKYRYVHGLRDFELIKQRRNVPIIIDGVARTMVEHAGFYKIEVSTLRYRYKKGLRDVDLLKPMRKKTS